MTILPPNCTSDEALAFCLEHEARETARLMTEYDPADEIEDHPSDPESWPAWTDADVWTLTEPQAAPESPAASEPYEPSAADLTFLATLPPVCGGAPNSPTDEDLAEAAQLAKWQARLEASHVVTDADLIAAGMAVG